MNIKTNILSPVQTLTWVYYSAHMCFLQTSMNSFLSTTPSLPAMCTKAGLKSFGAPQAEASFHEMVLSWSLSQCFLTMPQMSPQFGPLASSASPPWALQASMNSSWSTSLSAPATAMNCGFQCFGAPHPLASFHEMCLSPFLSQCFQMAAAILLQCPPSTSARPFLPPFLPWSFLPQSFLSSWS